MDIVFWAYAHHATRKGRTRCAHEGRWRQVHRPIVFFKIRIAFSK